MQSSIQIIIGGDKAAQEEKEEIMSVFKRESQFVVAQDGVADAVHDTITAAMDDYNKR